MPGTRLESKERGFTLITTAMLLIAFIAVCGLAIDVGRMYIAKGEAQTYADSAALAATLELDGTMDGLTNARNAVAANVNKWNLASSDFGSPHVYFSTAASGPWVETPGSATGVLFTRVVTQVSVPLSLTTVLHTGPSATVAAGAAAGQIEQTHFTNGLFPFSPYAPSAGSPPNYGFVVGQEYTLRWPSTINSTQSNVCSGDQWQGSVLAAQAAASQVRGYYGDGNSHDEREQIVNDAQIQPVTIGDSIDMTGGADNTQRDSIIDRVNQDTDPYSATYAAYQANVDGDGNRIGNGRRLIGAPFNLGPTSTPQYQVAGIAGFFLLPASRYSGAGGNDPLCAVYIGSWIQGSNNGGASSTGAYVVRLIE